MTPEKRNPFSGNAFGISTDSSNRVNEIRLVDKS